MAKVDVDEETLQKIADETGGNSFAPRTPIRLNADLRRDRPLGKNHAPMKKFEHYHELFALAVIPGLGCLALTSG